MIVVLNIRVTSNIQLLVKRNTVITVQVELHNLCTTNNFKITRFTEKVFYLEIALFKRKSDVKKRFFFNISKYQGNLECFKWNAYFSAFLIDAKLLIKIS